MAAALPCRCHPKAPPPILLSPEGAGTLLATTTMTDGNRGLDAIVGGAQDATANGERNDWWRIRQGRVANCSSINMKHFYYVSILPYYLTPTCRTPKLSTVPIAYDVGMRSVCLVWVPPAHRRCYGQKPPATMVG